ncbi:MAG: cation-transporting P-type ATPase, partial [Terracidiphilus sp.]
MGTLESNHAVESALAKVNAGALSAAATLPAPDESEIPAKAKQHNIRVSPAVLDAAGKDGDELLRSLRTTSAGLTQGEADSRARVVGPNEVAQERQRGWFIRLLIILRNPLVILLAVLSSISFATGDPRAGSVMAGMIVLSATLRFLQETRAGAAAAKLKAMI